MHPEENIASRSDPVDTANPIGIYRIELDGQWLFEDFSDLPHLYVQVYGFFVEMEAIVGGSDAPVIQRGSPWLATQHDLEPIGLRRFNYPWAGGWSSTNFYISLVRNLQHDIVPRVVRIQYASPGFIDLSVSLMVAAAVRRCINQTAKTTRDVHKTYDEIYRGMQERKLLAFDVRKKRLELEKEELAFLTESRAQLGAVIGLTAPEAKAVIQLSPVTTDKSLPENELGAVKVLLSLIRRIMGLAKYEEDGKARF